MKCECQLNLGAIYLASTDAMSTTSDLPPEPSKSVSRLDGTKQRRPVGHVVPSNNNENAAGRSFLSTPIMHDMIHIIREHIKRKMTSSADKLEKRQRVSSSLVTKAGSGAGDDCAKSMKR